MRFSPLVDRISGEGASAWDLHMRAVGDKRGGRDVIILSIGDPDFDTPQKIADGTIAALRKGDTHYSDILGLLDLRKKIAHWHQSQTGTPTGVGNVAVVAGAQCGLFVASLCLLSQGDEVAVLEPMYVTYEATIQAPGAKLVRVPQRPENEFHLDPRDLEAAITSKTRAIFYASPCNPTGAMMSRQTLEEIAKIAIEHDLWVVADEVYGTLAFEREHISIASLPGMAERTVTVNSLSKSHAMTGWRMGWVVAPEQFIRHTHNLGLAMLYGLPPFLQRGALAAFDELPEVPMMRSVYQKRRDMAVSRLNQVPGLKCHVPEAGMFMMLDVRGTGRSSRDFAWGLYEETGVAVLDASAFGASAEGHVRMSFVVDDDSLSQACQRISAYTSKLMTEA